MREAQTIGKGYYKVKIGGNGQEGRGGGPCGHGELLYNRRLGGCDPLTCVPGFGRKGGMNGEINARKEREETISRNGERRER